MASARYDQRPRDFFDAHFENGLRFSLVWLIWAIPLLIILWLASGIFIVGPDEQGVVRRFGKAVRITEPGPHYHLPIPIERADKVKVKQVRRTEIGFTTITQGPPARYAFRPEESLMLTGDEQIIDAQIIVQYQVSDPAKFLFNVRDLEAPNGAIKDAAEVALRHVVGQRPIDDVLIGEKLQVEINIRQLLQQIIDRYDAAEGYKAERTERAHGDAERFLAVLREYQNAKDVTRKRLYLETMEKILPGIRKFVIDSDTGGNLLQLLPLDERTR